MSGGDWKEMYVAAERGDLDLVRYHISNGIDPNYQHPEMLATPLVAAINAGHTAVALYLLGKNADPELRSFYDHLTPWEAATRMKNEAVLQRLRELGICGPVPWWQHLKKLFWR